jgi:hypothetical protein
MSGHPENRGELRRTQPATAIPSNCSKLLHIQFHQALDSAQLRTLLRFSNYIVQVVDLGTPANGIPSARHLPMWLLPDWESIEGLTRSRDIVISEMTASIPPRLACSTRATHPTHVALRAAGPKITLHHGAGDDRYSLRACLTHAAQLIHCSRNTWNIILACCLRGMWPDSQLPVPRPSMELGTPARLHSRGREALISPHWNGALGPECGDSAPFQWFDSL